MSKEIKLVFMGEPKAVQSFRFTRAGRKYQPSEVVAWKSLVRLDTRDQLPAGFTLFTGPVEIVSARFVFPPPKSMLKAKLAAIDNGWTVFKTTKPDLTDNLFKGLVDALSGLVWERDQQICATGQAVKVYGRQPRTELVVREIEEVQPPSLRF